MLYLCYSTRRNRVTRDKTPQINTHTYTHTSRRHLHRLYVATCALLASLNSLNLLDLLGSLNTLALIDLQPLPAAFTKFKGGAQRPLRLTHIREACSPTGSSKEVKLVCAGAQIPLGSEASGKERPTWGF